MARLPEVHVWRDEFGGIRRCEFRDGSHKMEDSVTKIVSTNVVRDASVVELTVIANVIYHDSNE